MKHEGKFDDYKKRRAKLEKERRIRLKDSLGKLTEAKRNQFVIENRIKNRKGVQRFRARQKQKAKSPAVTQVTDETIQNVPLDTSSTQKRQETISPSSTQNCQVTKSTENCNCKRVPVAKRQHETLVSNSNIRHSYKTPSALSKAISKAKKSLPTSPSRRKVVASGMLRSFREDEQQEIIGDLRPARVKKKQWLEFRVSGRDTTFL